LNGNAFLHSLDSQYHLRSGRNTSEFIERHPKVSAALLALTPHIKAYFGRSIPTVEAICDPEEASEKLRIQILTSLPPAEAMNALDSVESAWLGHTSPAIAELFVLTIAPK
jgi:hypothetical protein